MKNDIGTIKHSLILLGAGNAHLQFVKRYGMKPIPHTEVTLISESPQTPYSAMVPGYLAGQYEKDTIQFDLVKLCAIAKVRYIPYHVEKIDTLAKRLYLKDRPPIGYDTLSINIGCLPTMPPNLDNLAISVRPLQSLIQSLDLLSIRIQESDSPTHLVIVGAGASGCELALALNKRFNDSKNLKITLIHSHKDPLPEFPKAISRHFIRLCKQRKIDLILNKRVVDGTPHSVVLDNGESITCDQAIWATNATPTPLLKESKLDTDERGFLKVKDTLQSHHDPNLFATGDCISFQSNPNLPKTGVYAVRQGPILWKNIIAHIEGRALKKYRPQIFFLTLLNTSDEKAILRYGPFSIRGGWVWSLKKWLDRRWRKKFVDFYEHPKMLENLTEEQEAKMRCGGCGAKVPGEVLSNVLHRIHIKENPQVLVGCHDGEDASVHRPPEGEVEVQSVDFFRAFIDDPYLFGKIAATNSISDIFAMNAKPAVALATVTLPYSKGAIQEDLLFQILSGASEVLNAHNVTLTGGHTAEAGEMALGLTVTGYGDQNKLFRKGNLQENQTLILTKPIGSGALLAGWMRGKCRAEWFQTLIQSLCQTNGPLTEILSENKVTACTDITGFGLAGHLMEMLRASQISAKLWPEKIPLYRGFEEVTRAGVFSTLHKENAKISAWVKNPKGEGPELLYDPQTSGGFLFGLPSSQAEPMVQILTELGHVQTAIIGETCRVKDSSTPQIFIE